jgi:PAS domain S-box-containing protein
MPTCRGDGGERSSRDQQLRREAAELLEGSPWWAGQAWRERAYTETRTRHGDEAGVVAADLLGVVTHWSPGAERLYGWKEGEILGRPIVDLLIEDGDRHRAIEAMEAAVREQAWDGMLDVRPKQGHPFSVLVSLRPVLDDENREVGFVGVSRPAPAAT